MKATLTKAQLIAAIAMYPDDTPILLRVPDTLQQGSRTEYVQPPEADPYFMVVEQGEAMETDDEEQSWFHPHEDAADKFGAIIISFPDLEMAR